MHNRAVAIPLCILAMMSGVIGHSFVTKAESPAQQKFSGTTTSLSVLHEHGINDGADCIEVIPKSTVCGASYNTYTIDGNKVDYLCKNGHILKEETVDLSRYAGGVFIPTSDDIPTESCGQSVTINENILKCRYDTSKALESVTVTLRDKDYEDGMATLTANIIEGAYKDKWTWSDEDKIVWSSGEGGSGTVYGKGLTIDITEPGTYYFTLLGSAADFTTTTTSGSIEVTKEFVRAGDLYFGAKNVNRLKFGEKKVEKVYLGKMLIKDYTN